MSLNLNRIVAQAERDARRSLPPFPTPQMACWYLIQPPAEVADEAAKRSLFRAQELDHVTLSTEKIIIPILSDPRPRLAVCQHTVALEECYTRCRQMMRFLPECTKQIATYAELLAFFYIEQLMKKEGIARAVAQQAPNAGIDIEQLAGQKEAAEAWKKVKDRLYSAESYVQAAIRAFLTLDPGQKASNSPIIAIQTASRSLNIVLTLGEKREKKVIRTENSISPRSTPIS
jgi:hypothetical protein